MNYHTSIVELQSCLTTEAAVRSGMLEAVVPTGSHTDMLIDTGDSPCVCRFSTVMQSFAWHTRDLHVSFLDVKTDASFLFGSAAASLHIAKTYKC